MTTSHREVEGSKQKIRRRATSKGLSFGPIATAITVGTVAVLLGVTFIGDWLRTPKIAAEASPSIISPNGDQAQDSTNFSYTLNEDAEVTIQVFDQNNRLVHTLVRNEFQTRGRHVAVWDGRNTLDQVTADGRYQLRVTAQGTMRASSQEANVTVDTLPPTLRLANLDEVARVREANLTVEGLTDPNAVIQLTGEPAAVPVDAEGRFTIKRQLNEGSNVIEVSATDSAGNQATVAREVILVTEPPEVAVISPENGEWTSENLITVAGTVPSGTRLRVNGQEAAVNNQGEFNREVILQEGENVLKIEAIDDVGNVTSQEMIVRRKTTPPFLTVNIEEGEVFQQSEIQVIGKTDPNTIVSIGGQTVPVSSLGEFQATVNLLTGDNLLDVVAQDQAGNTTQLQRRVSFRVTPPESELSRVARNLPDLSVYIVPVLIALPILLIIAYFLTRPVALVVSAESSSFKPGMPEEGRFLRMAIELSKPARTTVEIKDKRKNTVATLLHRRHRSSGQHTLYWDGYDDFGRVVPPGEYMVQASANTTGGSVQGTLNIAILEDRAVHRQYLRSAPYQDDEQRLNRRLGEVVRTGAPAKARRRT
ncbi:MAG TPA: FlgD immunoglobulin-like domain containing protein [Anaerolineae bacterium]|nr:FlgD immunoglobulin-like domain containing protein [Anaerolineae bacterium]